MAQIRGFSREGFGGCPNSGDQHWIADIGIEGKKTRVGDKLVDAYHFCVGGLLSALQATARPVGYCCPARDVADAIERLLCHYLNLRHGENLRQFFARHSEAELRSFLAGEFVEAVPRDLPARHASGAACD
jgi:sulfite reductase (ferredoxin)